jgi:RNA polymerase sigma factor (TIGR02999 family)
LPRHRRAETALRWWYLPGLCSFLGLPAFLSSYHPISFFPRADVLACRLCGCYVRRMSQVTRILSAIEAGDPTAAEQLLPLVYQELRQLAAQRLAQEKPGQTLQATALVHEAYLRLVDVEKARHWDSRGHFFAAAAESMRRILIDKARRRRSRRRGGQAQRQSLEGLEAAAPASDDELLAVDEALVRLQKLDSAKAELVKLRYFGGLTIPEAAQALGISVTTANRYWVFARAWLHEELGGCPKRGLDP